MIPSSKQEPSEAASSRVRVTFWLLLLSGLMILAALSLPRPGATKAPEPLLPPPPDIAAQDLPASNPPLTSATPLAPATEPLPTALAGWVLDLESTNAAVAQAARKALADLGPEAAPAIPQLARLLADVRTCNSAAWVLAIVGTNALPVLLDALTNGNRNARVEVAGAIGMFREAGEAAIPGLVECMQYNDPLVRANALASLLSILKRPDLAVPALIATLADRDAKVRISATRVLQKYGQVEADATIPALVQAARQEQNPLMIRSGAAEILRTIAPERATAEGL
jgi:HEAT repeat protein